MTDNTQELDEILAKHGAEAGEITHSLKQALLDWHNKQVEAVLDRLKGQQIPVAALRNDTNEFEQIQAIPVSAIEAERNKLNNSDGDVK